MTDDLNDDGGSRPVTAPNPADHPHTDPGDGRKECQPCGKWVFPAIHSCKGIPVTTAARARFDAAREPVTNAEQWLASVNTAADILRAYIAREAPDMVPLLFSADYEGMAMALESAGRLVPAGARERWSVACQSCSPDGWTPGPGCAACWPVPTTKDAGDPS